VLRDGSVQCWGFAQLPTTRDCSGVAQPHPAPVGGLAGVAQLVLGLQHACARMSDGTVRCWGSDRNGMLGTGLATEGAIRCQWMEHTGGTTEYLFRATPAPALGLRDVVQLALGSGHTCALTRAGRVYCWGENYQGQLGDDSTTARATPTEPRW
jgi:alpha-tubulin suppressor-like RCC1 family protein